MITTDFLQLACTHVLCLYDRGIISETTMAVTPWWDPVLILWTPGMIGTSFVPFSTVRWAPCYSGWALFQRTPWPLPHGSSSFNTWLDWYQFFAFLYSQMSSLLLRMLVISEPQWQSPHGSDSLSAWLDWCQFCTFHCSQRNSLESQLIDKVSFYMISIFDTTYASTCQSVAL